MNLGTFDDIRRLERTLGPHRLADIMLQAEPGWLSDRSWEFWRGRLSLALGKALPEEPPRRSLNAAADLILGSISFPTRRKRFGQASRQLPDCPSCSTEVRPIALHLGHRQSVDFDFFRDGPLDKGELRKAFAFIDDATVLQDTPDTLAVLATMPSGPVKILVLRRDRIRARQRALQTRDGTLLVASLDDLMATKLKATLDRAEARDYRDIARDDLGRRVVVPGTWRLQADVQGRAFPGLARDRIFQGRRFGFAHQRRPGAAAECAGIE